MSEQARDLQVRTKEFALRVLRMYSRKNAKQNL